MSADWMTPADWDGHFTADAEHALDSERIEAEIRRRMAARARIPHNACGCYTCGPSNRNARIDAANEIDGYLDDYLFVAGPPPEAA